MTTVEVSLTSQEDEEALKNSSWQKSGEEQSRARGWLMSQFGKSFNH